MKKIILSIITLCLGSFFLQAQQNQVPLETIKEIADRNAKALWGNVYSDVPIPYYSAQDEIIAYRFNYSLNQPFPDKNEIITICKHSKDSGNRDVQWGGESYGRILLGAIKSLPPIIEYSKSLSVEYAESSMLQEIASKELGYEFALQKIYYINEANQWFCYSNGEETRYIKLFPPLEVLDKSSFQQTIQNKNVFIEPGDYSSDWASYESGKTLDPKAAVYIPNHELCPFYDWSYGCSPTAAAMLFGWWDYRSLYSSWDFGLLIEYYFYRWDDIEGEWDYQIPWMQRILAIGMDTDTTTGSTSGIDIKDGIEYAAAQRGYSFDASDYVTSEWDRLRDEIDDNRPLIASIPGHSTTGIGYNNSDNHFATHYTHQGSIVWVHKDELDRVTLAEPDTDFGQGITLTFPEGDTNYNATGGGEIFYVGDEYEITWDYESSIPSTTSIYYSINGNGGFVSDVIAYNTANDGSYTWMVPIGTYSDLCRLGVINYNASSQMIGMDCTQGMFTIYSPPDIQLLSSGVVENTDYDPDYFRFQHPNSSWSVVAIRALGSSTNWDIKCYSNLNFNSVLVESDASEAETVTDFIVIDGNHTSSTAIRGIKVDRVLDDDDGKVVYEGDNSSVSLGTQSIYFAVSAVAQIFEAHLEPGYYTFTLENTGGSGDVNMAFFSSVDGDYYQNFDDAMAISNFNGYDITESFTVYIETEDDYGLCIWTATPATSTWDLTIEEEHPGIWEGDYNSLWSNSNNWSLDIVPSIGTDVTIPAGTQYEPYVTSYSFCKNITIESGATLRVYSANLVAGGDMLVRGNLRVYADQSLSVNGDIIWTSSASEYMGDNSSINVGEDWTFDYGSSIHLGNGKVRFAGIEHSMIYCRSDNSWFNEVEVDKLLETALVSYEMTPGLQNLQINGDFNGLVGNFICPSMMSIIFKGQDLNITDDFNFSCSAGSFIFQGDANQYIYFNPTSNFNNLVIESTGNIYLQDPITIDQNVYINWGILASNSYTIEVGGGWYNSPIAGEFWQSSGTVIFTGYGNRECTGEQFHILELNKTSGELRFPEGVTECDVYNYTQGTIRVNGGTFIADDLMDSGIFGTIIITEGNLEYHQDESQFIDLRGNLTMSGGNFTIYGGGDNSYWPYLQNASITMSDGTLDIVDNGIRIHNTNYSLTENITGGRIRTAYGFDIYRDDFTPTGGVIELYGTTDEYVIVSGTSYFHDLQINKSSKNYTSNTFTKKPRHEEQQNGTKSNSITASSNLDINGDFILSAGTFDAPGKMFVAGNWQNNAGSAAFIEGMDTVYIDGNADQYCNFEQFYNLILVKNGGEFILNADDVFVTNYDWASGNLTINGGGLIVDDLVDDGIYGNITIIAGGIEFNQGSSSGEYVDLNGNLSIHGGIMYINGGSDDSYWPYAHNASLNMSGGYLDFQTVGIYVYNSPTYTFTENITGGTIKTSQGFRGNRNDFIPTGGILELYGPDNAQISMGTGSNLFNLEVNKSGKGVTSFSTQTESRMGNTTKGTKANLLTFISNIDIDGYCVLQGSSINFNGHRGKFGSDVQLTNNGIMILDANAELMLGSGSNITFKSGAVFESMGSAGNEALVTSESGYYNFATSVGGIIRAEHTIFENMGTNGIYIYSGGLVDEAFSFNNCTFRNGINTVGSSLLKIHNSQVLTISNASFPILMSGGPCNAAKLQNEGEITFLDPTGPFCGCFYENDPYGRIYWESSTGYNVALTAYLEGAFDGISMTTMLNDENLIPLLQPYSTQPWNYSGTESVAVIPPNVVDWVLVELRDATDAASANSSRIFARKAAFILNNGYIVDMDGTSSIFFNDVFNQDMYTVVYHRNHLPVLSSNPAIFSAGKYSYNFSTSGTQVHGGNAAHKELAPGYWGLFGGNGDVDDEINESDKINVWGPQSGKTEYLNGDFNLNGEVNNPDKNDIWIENIGYSSQIPD